MTTMTTDSDQRLFRRAAVEHAFARTSDSDVLSLTTFWTGGGFWLVMLSLVATVALASAVHVDVSRGHPRVERCSLLRLLFDFDLVAGEGES